MNFATQATAARNDAARSAFSSGSVAPALSSFPAPLLNAASAASQPPNGLQAGMLANVLDEIDHGLLLVDLTGRIVHANYPARRELAAGRALATAGGMLTAPSGESQSRLRQALKDAAHDCRSIVELAHADEPLSLAFIPMGTPVDTVLVMCNRRRGVESLTVQMFARARRLTKSEQNVLSQLCAGHGAEEIAALQGIQLSTVRTHIKNVRQKTGSTSIREIVQRVSRMPQIVSALRMAAAYD